MKPSSSNEENHDVENAKLDKVKVRTPRNGRVVKLHNQALLSGLAYCFSSCGMILVNKFVLSSYDFNAGISLMLYQVFFLFGVHWIFYPFVHCVVMLKLLELDWFWHFFCVDAEFNFSWYCLRVEPSGFSFNWAADMEIDQGLVACEFYICWNARYKHV